LQEKGMDFEAYLAQKKIDSKSFKKAEPGQWEEFKNLFDQVHPESFTAQKLFLINAKRRAYPLKEMSQETTEPAKKAVRPVINKKS
jgi:hypothetical protein